MANFTFTPLALDGLQLVEPTVFGDARGYFMETYNRSEFEKAGITQYFVQDNESMSKRGVVRGLHFQTKHTQAKLVHAIAGEVLDVAVDIRRGSPTFGKHVAVLLTAENRRQVFVPEGFAHGYAVLSETAVFAYKCGDIYAPQYEASILCSDPDLAIDWRIPTSEQILSQKDERGMSFAAFCESDIIF